MSKLSIITGNPVKSPHKHQHVPLEMLVGKTIEAVAKGTVEGADGNETCIYLLFSDGTKHGFVIAEND